MDIPRSLKLVGPETLRIRQGGGCLALFGVPFLLAGIFLVLVVLGIVPVSNAGDLPRWAPAALLALGAVFTAVGGGLALGRRWITLDRVGGQVVLQRGLLLPLTRQERSLSFYNSVALEVRPGDSDSGPSYAVVLKGWGGQPDLPVCTMTSYAEAWDSAGYICEFLRCPLVDRTTDHPQRLEAGEEDRPLVERALGGEEPAAAPPSVLRSQVEESGGVLRITIPAPELPLPSLVAVVVPVGLALLAVPLLLDFFRVSHTAGGIKSLFLAVVLVFVGVSVLLGVGGAALRARRGGTIVTVSRLGIDIEERSAARSRTRSISAEDILGLDYGTAAGVIASATAAAATRLAARGATATDLDPQQRAAQGLPPPLWLRALARLATSKGVLVKSRQGIVAFGAGLPDDEVAYLYGLVRAALRHEEAKI